MNWKAFFLVLATIICDGCALYFGYTTLWLMGFFLTLLVFLAGVFILCSYWWFSFHQELSQTAVEKHVPADLLLRFENKGILLHAKVKLYDWTGEKRKISVYPGVIQQQIRYIFHKKGKYAVGLRKIVLFEPFGIFCRRIHMKEAQSLYVLPKVLREMELDIPYLGESSEEGNQRKRTVDRSLISDLREYEYGDSLNSINWKATAKRNEVIVNQYENAFTIKTFIYVDAFPRRAARWEEQACDEAVTQIKAVLRQEGAVTLLQNGKITAIHSSMVKAFQEYGIYLAEPVTTEDQQNVPNTELLMQNILFQKEIYNYAVFFLHIMTPQIQSILQQLQNQHVHVVVYQNGGRLCWNA